MRQVTKEEYDVLKKFHPHETRYYVDLNGVKVKRKKCTRSSPARIVTGDKLLEPYTINETQNPFRAGTKSYKVLRCVMNEFRKVKCKPMTRDSLVAKVAMCAGFKTDTVQPIMSKLLRDGWVVVRDEL